MMKCRYSTWNIPVNIVKQQQQGQNIIRAKPSELIHPFYNIGNLEQLLLSLKYKDAALVNGKPVFGIYDKHTKKFIPKSIKVRNTFDLPEWVDSYSFHVHNNVFKNINNVQTIHMKDFAKTFRKTYINSDTSANINSIITVLKKNANSEKIFQPLNLVSLIDGIVMTTDGVYTEDVYTYMLQKHCNHPQNVLLILNSIMFHIDTLKLDQPEILEKLLAETIAVLKNPSFKMTELQQISILSGLESLIQRINMKSQNHVFKASTNLQLLDLSIDTQRPQDASGYLRKLIFNNNFIPERKIISRYLTMLSKCFPNNNTNKMGFVGDMSNVIMWKMTPELLNYLIPLCSDFIEIRTLIQISLRKKELSELIQDDSLSAIIKQTLSVDKNDIMKGIHITEIYKILSESHLLKKSFIPLFFKACVKINDYPMLANLIVSKNILLKENSSMVNDLISNMENTSDIRRDKFMINFVLPHIDELALTEKSMTVLQDLENRFT